MSRYVPLDANQHAQGGWLPYTDYLFAADQTLVAVSLEEVPHILKSVPLAFREVGAGCYQLVAVQSLTQNVNLCVAPNGRWLTGYIPALYRAYPFRLQPNENQRQWSLCVDMDSGLWLANAGEQGKRCFNDSGEDSETLKQLRSFLNKVMQGQALAARAVNALANEQLIQPWPLKTQGDNEQVQQVEGLYRIDEKRLNALAPEALSTLRDAGGLSLAYAQLLSQHRLNNLAELYRLHHTAAPNVESLDEWFEESDDLQLSFDD